MKIRIKGSPRIVSVIESYGQNRSVRKLDPSLSQKLQKLTEDQKLIDEVNRVQSLL